MLIAIAKVGISFLFQYFIIGPRRKGAERETAYFPGGTIALRYDYLS
jgi:hypothetical protein